jgi:hypothetical protein
MNREVMMMMRMMIMMVVILNIAQLSIKNYTGRRHVVVKRPQVLKPHYGRYYSTTLHVATVMFSPRQVLHCVGRGVIERLTAPVQILLRDLLSLPAHCTVNNMQLKRGLRVADWLHFKAWKFVLFCFLSLGH